MRLLAALVPTVGLLLIPPDALAQAPPRARSQAQAPRDGRLLVTVADQTGAVLPGATVVVTGQESVTRAMTIDPATTSEQGVAAIAGLVPGRYVVQAAFPGFATKIAPDVRVRAGDNKQTVVLEIEKLTDEITVGRDKQEAAADARVTFGSTMTREQVDALSDNPEEMRKQLLDMGGPGAVIRGTASRAPICRPSRRSSRSTSRATPPAETQHGAIFVEITTGIGPLAAGAELRWAQSLHAGQRRGAHRELRHELRRLDRAAEKLLFSLGRRHDLVRHVELERCAGRRRTV